MTEYLIDCRDAVAFDKTIKQMGQAQLVRDNGAFKKRDGHFIMRIYADADYVAFTIENQQFGTIVSILP